MKGKNGDVMALTIGIVVPLYYAWLYLLPVYLKQLGYSDADVGRTFSILLFLWNGGKLFGGFLSDRFGRKPLIIFPGLISFVGLILASITRHPLLVVIGVAMDYFASGAQSPAMLAIIADTEKEPGKAYGRMEAAYALGIAIGPFLGAWTYDIFGIQGLMAATALVVLVVALMRSAMLVESARLRRHGRWPKLKIDREVLVFTLALTLMFAAFSITIYGPYISLFERDFLKFSEKEINMSFFFGNTLASIVGLGLAHRITRKNYRTVWLVSMVMLTGLLALWSHIPLMPIFLLSFPFGQATHIAFMVGMATFGDDQTRGSLIGLMSSVSGMMGSFSSSLGAFLIKKNGYTGPFDAGLAMGIATALIILKLKGPKEERRAEPVTIPRPQKRVH